MKKTSKILFTLFVTLALLPGTLLTAYGFQFDPALPGLDELAQPCLMYSVGHVIAHKYIEVNNEQRPLIVVAIRGTAYAGGWIANIHALLASGCDDLGFKGAAKEHKGNTRGRFFRVV